MDVAKLVAICSVVCIIANFGIKRIFTKTGFYGLEPGGD